MNDINQKIEECRNNPAVILLDVREVSEYVQGHIPGALNHPLSMIGTIAVDIPDRNAEVYVYCQSGYRAQRAVNLMKQQGYAHVENIGGIEAYQGLLEK